MFPGFCLFPGFVWLTDEIADVRAGICQGRFPQGYSSMCDREWANDDDKAVIDSAG